MRMYTVYRAIYLHILKYLDIWHPILNNHNQIRNNYTIL